MINKAATEHSVQLSSAQSFLAYFKSSLAAAAPPDPLLFFFFLQWTVEAAEIPIYPLVAHFHGGAMRLIELLVMTDYRLLYEVFGCLKYRLSDLMVN